MGATDPLYYDVSIPEVVNAIRARLTTLKNGYDSVMAHFFYQLSTGGGHAPSMFPALKTKSNAAPSAGWWRACMSAIAHRRARRRFTRRFPWWANNCCAPCAAFVCCGCFNGAEGFGQSKSGFDTGVQTGLRHKRQRLTRDRAAERTKHGPVNHRLRRGN